MSTAFIADLHLSADRPQSTLWFQQFMRNAPNSLKQIYILGDLFDYWVGDDGAETLNLNLVEEIIRQTVESGVAVFFMHGNRDFLAGDDFAERSLCYLISDPTVIVIDDKKILLSHGDMLCSDDVEHQKQRAIMYQSQWKNDFLKKPLAERINIAEQLRQASEKNKKNKSMSVMDVTQTAVEKLMIEHGVTTLIHGHTHKPAVHTFSINNQPYNRYVLGDWYEQKSMLLYDNNCFNLS